MTEPLLSVASLDGPGEGTRATGSSQPDPELVVRARAFVADVDSAIARHGFSIKVTYRDTGPSLTICRAEDHEAVLIVEQDDWRPISRSGALD